MKQRKEKFMERCLWRLGLYEKELDEETIEENK